MATRLDGDISRATATRIVAMVSHLLREEEVREFFCQVKEVIDACLVRRDELLSRERQRLGKPPAN